jgi:hypothetical protein
MSTDERMRRSVLACELLRQRRIAWNTRSAGREAFESVARGEARLCVRHPETASNDGRHAGGVPVACQWRASGVRPGTCACTLATSFGCVEFIQRTKRIHTPHVHPSRGAGYRGIVTRRGARKAVLHAGLLTSRPFGLKRKAPKIELASTLLTYGCRQPTTRESRRSSDTQEVCVFRLNRQS